jgi:hypothetical protein
VLPLSLLFWKVYTAYGFRSREPAFKLDNWSQDVNLEVTDVYSKGLDIRYSEERVSIASVRELLNLRLGC